MRTIRVATVHGRPRTLQTLTAILDDAPGVSVVARFPTWDDAAGHADGESVDVVVGEMPASVGDALIALRRLLSQNAHVQVLLLAGSDDPDWLAEAVRAGVRGYLLEKSPPERIVQAVRELHDGGALMLPGIASRVLELLRSALAPHAENVRLTTRELQVLRLLAEGHSYKTAAAELGLGVDTARFHIRNIYEKLHVHSKSEAVLAAFRGGLLT